MTAIIDGLQTFCLHRDIVRVAELTGGVVIEEADEPDLAWLNPPT
jgi:dihydroorotate dehydrogenase (NAD+) catalytic subunit